MPLPFPPAVLAAFAACVLGMLGFPLQHALLRKRTTTARRIGDLAGFTVLAASAASLLALSVTFERADPEHSARTVLPMRAVAVITLVESFFALSYVWLPWAFDRLESAGGAMLLAVRQLRSRKSGFLTAISFLAFFGVGLSTCGLCGTLSVMGGFGNDLKQKILGNNPHVVIDGPRDGFSDWQPLVAAARRVPGVENAAPLVQGEVMITSQTNLSGVIVRGIDPSDAVATQRLSPAMIRGSLSSLAHPERLLDVPLRDRQPVSARDDTGAEPARAPSPSREPVTDLDKPPAPPALPAFEPMPGTTGGTQDLLPGVVIGRELASQLHLVVGDDVRLVSPFGGMLTPAGPLPKTRLFRVAGIFYSGMYEYDVKYAYLAMPIAQEFFNLDRARISLVELRVREVDTADSVAAAVRALPEVSRADLRVRDWKQMNSNLFRALRLERLMMFVLLGVAIVVASFAIVATLLLFVSEKGREIAVLKAMGGDGPFVARVFVLVGLLIGLVGSVMGVGVAVLVCVLILKLGFPLDPEVYYINRLPVAISPMDYLWIVGVTLAVCLLATLYPAWSAARLRPVDGLRVG